MEKKFLIPAKKRIQQYVDNVEFRGRVLDVGTGSGVLALVALNKGITDVTAIDINQDAVDHVAKNFPQIKVIHSDLFANVSGQFDTITFAAPWSEGEVTKPFDYALYDLGTVQKFLRQVSDFMNPGAVVWLQYCDAYPALYNALPGWVKDGGLEIRQSWHYEMWGELVQRDVKVYLYRVEKARA